MPPMTARSRRRRWAPASRSWPRGSPSRRRGDGEMIVVYDTQTYRIVGHASRVFDNGKWREPTIDEVFPGHLDQRLDALYLPDEPRLLAYGTDQYRLLRDVNGAVTGIELAPRIILS